MLPGPPAPPALRAVVALLALEGAALVLLGAGYAVVSALGRPESLAGAELAAAFAAAAGVLLLLVARATSRRRAWGRSPGVLLNLLAVPVGVGLLQAGLWLIGVPMLGVALATLVLLLTPAVRTALVDET